MAVEALPPIIDAYLVLFWVNWDLKALADACQTHKQYSFLLTSSPLNFPGAIGSPLNALAIL
ncbi:hypothetical protein N7475_005597 [Penicillium sp. IBT 31633x]|nr:hypothetical protein N7475_005597 [Penicillium sp. IBT 31633x]